MGTLRITVDWLDRTYHGEEWPPSPNRIFRAMRAGYARHHRDHCALDAAMRHLETLDPPVITAPRVEVRPPITAAVPNNDGDRELALYARGEPAHAREQRRRSVALRTRFPRVVDGELGYDWPATPETAGHAEAIVTIARCVSAVGLGMDLAVARAALVERPAPLEGVRYTPSAAGRRILDVPYPGAFEDLEERYRQLRGRIDAGVVSPVWEPERRPARYHCELDLPPVRCGPFALLGTDGKPLGVEGTRAMEVAAMVRHAIGRAARRAGIEQGVVSELMGHGGDARIAIHPLPNAGHRHADGRIRRVVLTAPESVDEAVWVDVLTRLAGEALCPERRGDWGGVLAPLAGADPLLGRLLGESRVWTTATPVVLPGYDHRRGRARPQRSVRRMLRHAGVGEALVESVALEPGPRLAGSAHPARYRRPRHLARYPCVHLSVRWTMPVTGPLALGAGVGYGLGLFLPVGG